MRIHARISDKVGEEFRKRIKELYGDKKMGAVSRAVEEAIILWLKHTEFLVEAKKVRKDANTNKEQKA